MTSSLTNLGMAEINVGNFAAARPLFEQSLEIAQEIGDVVGTMIGAVNTATLDYKLGDFAQARRGYRQALLEGRDLGDRLGLTYAMLGLAAVDAASGQDLAGAASWLAVVQATLGLLGAALEPYEQAIYDETLALVSSRLAPAEFAAAWEAGLALALGDQSMGGAVAAALGE
jgi:tetratricopeptide (TPR) repeat protein